MRMTMMVTTTISSTKVKPRRLLPLRIRGPIQSYFIGGAANVEDAGLGLAHGLAGVLRNGAPIWGVGDRVCRDLCQAARGHEVAQILRRFLTVESHRVDATAQG